MQAYLERFLKLHASTIRSDEGLRAKCRELREVQRASWQSLETLFHEDLSLLGFLVHLQG
jgi:hypothetical protein